MWGNPAPVTASTQDDRNGRRGANITSPHILAPRGGRAVGPAPMLTGGNGSGAARKMSDMRAQWAALLRFPPLGEALPFHTLSYM